MQRSTPPPVIPPIPADIRQIISLRTFSTRSPPDSSDVYLDDPALKSLVEFFQRKGLKAIKCEDQSQQWYEDWIAYQASKKLYASLLSPSEYSRLGNEFNLLRLTRFLEAFAYFSPAHGYSLQVTFLGLFAILMGTNTALKREAVAALEQGALLAFGISEKKHGSDLLANDFTVVPHGPAQFIASGTKYYIGNANCATIIAVLAREVEGPSRAAGKRAAPVLFALRPRQAKGFGNVKKIPTLGIRSAYVGEFTLDDHPLPQSDVLAKGRDAWEAVLGAVTLGKFFLGFGSVGICEHAFEEVIAHLSRRILYGKPAIALPHLSAFVSQAYARLSAMKLYAYRALDYVHAAHANDRRYLLFNAVQKAKVSTEGVKVMSLLSDCVGAWGFQSETYFEMALRDIQLIPGLEGSSHINIELTAQFIPRYLTHPDRNLAPPPSLAAGACEPTENPYLSQARGTSINSVAFPPHLNAYRPLLDIPNVRHFVKQAKAFHLLVRGKTFSARAPQTLAYGTCLATIAYGQLIAENSVLFSLPAQLVSAIFHLLVSDLSAIAFSMASSGIDPQTRTVLDQMMIVPQTSPADWDFVLNQARTLGAPAPADHTAAT